MHKLSASQVHRLIDSVREHPELYDRRVLGYSELHKKEKIWFEIAGRIGVSNPKICIKAWKSLRDQFIKNHKSLLKNQYVDNQEARHYKYYDSLVFLADCIQANRNASAFDSMIDICDVTANGSDNQLEEVEFHPFREYAEKFAEKYKTEEATIKNTVQRHTITESQAPTSNIRTLLEVLIEKTYNKNDDIDKFFLVLSAMVKRCNLTTAEFARLQCYLMNDLKTQLQDFGKI